jgi:acyl-CoA hydrolase
MTELVLPNDANILGNVLGGKVLHLIDIAAAVCAHRHCRRQVVTASMDRVDFLHPVKMGHVMILHASVNYVGRTSMEVGVKVESEDLMTGLRQKTASAYTTFVALDERGKPAPVPPLVLEGAEQERRFREGAARREQRLAELAQKRVEKQDETR